MPSEQSPCNVVDHCESEIRKWLHGLNNNCQSQLTNDGVDRIGILHSETFSTLPLFLDSHKKRTPTQHRS